MIRADLRAEPPVGHGQVLRDERVVDRDPEEREVRRPARLPAEPEPGVAEARVAEEVGEQGGALATVQVADHDPGAPGRADAIGQGGQLGEPAPPRGGNGMDQPEMARLPRERELGVKGGPALGEQALGRARLRRPRPEPEGQAPDVGRGLDPVREVLADLGQPVAPGGREFDQADDVRAFATDEPGQGVVIHIVHEHVGHQDAEPGRRTRVGRDRVRPPVIKERDRLQHGQDREHDGQPSIPPGCRGQRGERDRQPRELEV
jgi:hypothetical protein